MPRKQRRKKIKCPICKKEQIITLIGDAQFDPEDECPNCGHSGSFIILGDNGHCFKMAKCIYCDHAMPVSKDFDPSATCPKCGKSGAYMMIEDVEIPPEDSPSAFNQANDQAENMKRNVPIRPKDPRAKTIKSVKNDITNHDIGMKNSSHVNAGILDQDIDSEPWEDDPATEKQLTYLSRLGVEPLPGFTKGDAHCLKEQAQEGKAKINPITDRQRDFIITLGGYPESGMTADQASKYINWLLDQQICCPHCGSLISPFLKRCDSCGKYIFKASKSSRVPSSIYQRSSIFKTILIMLKRVFIN